MMMFILFFMFFIFFYIFGGLMLFSTFLLFLFIFLVFYGFILGLFDVGLLDYFFYMDFLGFLMLVLTTWSFSMVYLVSLYKFNKFSIFFYCIMFISLGLSFISSSIYMYYLFFEFSMLPIFFLIINDGSGEDRLISSYYMMVYTLLSSLPSLFIFLGLINLYGYGSFSLYSFLNYSIYGIYLFFIVVMFMVKVPLFIFHIWLPKAHVDAPVEGSMILASIMLKLGGYGLFRLLFMFNVDIEIFNLIFCMGLFGFFLMSLFSLFILDVKVLVAYSSVVHMCMMVCGILSGSLIGWTGGLLMMISHGICSSCMFMMANMVYVRVGSRCMIYNKGIFSILPMYSYFWLLVIMFNIGSPPSLSLFSEFYLLLGLMGVDFIYFILVVLGLFLISCSMLNLYNSFNLNWSGGSFILLMISEYFMIMIHLIPLVFLIFYVFLL